MLFRSPHTYDDDIMKDALRRYPDRTRFFENANAIHVCYTGNLYGIRGAALVANVARRMRTEDASKPIVIDVFGAVRGTDKRQLEALGPGVRFHGNVSYQESLAAMQHADVLLLLDVPSPGSPFFPSKLAEYLGTRRPIIALAADDSATARIAREMGLMLCPYTEAPIRIDAAVYDQPLDRRAVYANRAETYRELIEKMNGLAG